MNHNISLIYSRNPKERIPLLLNFLYEYGIRQSKKVYLQSFDLDSSYYINRLISLISQIDIEIIESYMFPLDEKSLKLKNKKIDTEKLILALDLLRSSNITINNSKSVENLTWLDYVFDSSCGEYNKIIIIDDFDIFIEKCFYDLNLIKKIIQKYSKKYKATIILFTSEEKLKQKFSHWMFARIDRPFKFIYDKNNFNLIDIVREDRYERKN